MNSFYEGVELDKKRIIKVIIIKIVSFLVFYLFIFLASRIVEKNGKIAAIEDLTRKDLTMLAFYLSICFIAIFFQMISYLLIFYIPQRLKNDSLGFKILFWMGFLFFITSLIFLFSLNKKFRYLIHQKYDEKRME